MGPEFLILIGLSLGIGVSVLLMVINDRKR